MAYVSPQTVLKALQEQILLLPPLPVAPVGACRTAGCTTPSLEHKSSTGRPGDTWSWGIWLHLLGLISFFLKLFFIYISCACAGVCGDTAGEEVSHKTYFKNEFKLANTVWHIRGGRDAAQHLSCPTLQHLEGKQQSRTQPSLCWMGKKQFTHTGKFAPTELLPVWNIHQLDHSQGRKGWSHPSKQGLPEGCESWRLQSFLNKSYRRISRAKPKTQPDSQSLVCCGMNLK